MQVTKLKITFDWLNLPFEEAGIELSQPSTRPIRDPRIGGAQFVSIMQFSSATVAACLNHASRLSSKDRSQPGCVFIPKNGFSLAHEAFIGHSEAESWFKATFHGRGVVCALRLQDLCETYGITVRNKSWGTLIYMKDPKRPFSDAKFTASFFDNQTFPSKESYFTTSSTAAAAITTAGATSGAAVAPATAPAAGNAAPAAENAAPAAENAAPAAENATPAAAVSAQAAENAAAPGADGETRDVQYGIKPWEKMSHKYREKAKKDIADDIEAAVRRRLHPNVIEQSFKSVLSDVLKFAGKKMRNVRDKNDRMQFEGESSVVQGLVQSYIDAPQKSLERQQILSSFSLSFTHDGINAYAFKGKEGIVISKFVKRAADEHARAIGPGRAHELREKFTRKNMDDDAMGYCIQVSFSLPLSCLLLIHH